MCASFTKGLGPVQRLNKWVTVLVSKPDDLCLIPGAHTDYSELSSDLPVYPMTSTYHTQVKMVEKADIHMQYQGMGSKCS